MKAATIRRGQSHDAAAVADIYNQGITSRLATFETEHRTSAHILAWLERGDLLLVSEREGVLAGFAATSQYRPRACYEGVREFSVYVHERARRQGHGSALLSRLADEARKEGRWKLVSRIFAENSASRTLCRSLGFREVGIYEKHGLLDGRWRDCVIVEKLLLE